jgi:hypothetical protein
MQVMDLVGTQAITTRTTSYHGTLLRGAFFVAGYERNTRVKITARKSALNAEA